MRNENNIITPKNQKLATGRLGVGAGNIIAVKKTLLNQAKIKYNNNVHNRLIFSVH